MSSGRPQNQDRQNALATGLPTYTGLPHARCGTRERYTKGGGCVHCARIIATEQREARKFLLQNRTALDTEPEAEVDTPEAAEARRQADIDELM